MNIKQKREEIERQIEYANRALVELQKTCPHDNTDDYGTFTPGQCRQVCRDCKHVEYVYGEIDYSER